MDTKYTITNVHRYLQSADICIYIQYTHIELSSIAMIHVRTKYKSQYISNNNHRVHRSK